MHPFTFFMLIFTLFFSACNHTPAITSTQLMPGFQSVSKNKAIFFQHGSAKHICSVCSMDLSSFYKTNHASTLKDGTHRQYCSLHCLVHDNEINKTDLYDLKVVDVATLKFIPAQSAYYVVGSDRPATMSLVSKYAFAKREDANRFAKMYGGYVMNFYDAYTIAYEDFVCRNK